MGLFAKLRLYVEDPHQHAGGSRRGGVFWDYERGISLGCPLSPLMGALFLKCLDERMEKSGLSYVRFMDDILMLSPTRWRLRKAVKLVNQVLGVLRLEKHLDKTFIGRIERGFDFLGYQIRPGQLSVAERTIEQFVDRAIRLYEQEPGEPVGATRLGVYVRRWVRWARSGLPAATASRVGFPITTSDCAGTLPVVSRADQVRSGR